MSVVMMVMVMVMVMVMMVKMGMMLAKNTSGMFMSSRK